jgi:hypothetical protein
VIVARGVGGAPPRQREHQRQRQRSASSGGPPHRWPYLSWRDGRVRGVDADAGRVIERVTYERR